MDSGLHDDQILKYAPNRHSISFQSSAVDSTNEMTMMFSGNSGYAEMGNSSTSVISDMLPVPGLKHDAALAVEWSNEEQNKLDQGISKYADEPSITRYVKIAATLRDKTVRDVALRCRWIASKRRKLDDFKAGRKFKDKTDKFVEPTSMPNVSSVSSLKVAPFSVTMNNRFQSNDTHLEAPSVSTRHLLEQNIHVFCQISTNISALKVQENFDLFNRAKNNITSILNDIRYMPGPPLPVSLNDDLANIILPATSQTMMFGSSSRVHLKQETNY